jgi:hypothetical protein
MKTHSRHTAANGKAFATLVETTSRRISIHLAINQNKRRHTTYALTIGQVRGVAQVLGAALADRGKTHTGGSFPRHVAEEGRAKAQLKHDYDGATIWLTVVLGSDRFLNIPLDIPDAEAVFSCATAALRDAQALMRQINGEGA